MVLASSRTSDPGIEDKKAFWYGLDTMTDTCLVLFFNLSDVLLSILRSLVGRSWVAVGCVVCLYTRLVVAIWQQSEIVQSPVCRLVSCTD